MEWWQQSDNYCERTDFTFWSEPVNAVTNAAFLIAAFVVWRALRGRVDGISGALIAILTAIGVGSFLFHTFATRWALLSDVLPILVFILVYLHAATVRFFALPWWAGLVAVVAYFPYSAALSWAVSATLGPLNGSVAYVPVAVLIAGYGVFLWQRARQTAVGLLLGAGTLALSLGFRTIDEAVCSALPLGTHFLWHGLNGVMLGWMIWVMAEHRRRTALVG